MILVRLTNPAIIKLLGKELLLVEELQTQEGIKYSVVDKLPPDLSHFCSHFFLDKQEFEIENRLASNEFAQELIQDFYVNHVAMISNQGYYSYYKQLLDAAQTPYEKALATATIATHAPQVDDWDFENIMRDVEGFLASIQELESDSPLPSESVQNSLDIAQKYKELNNHSSNIWEIVDGLGHHIGDSLSLVTYAPNTRELKEIRIAAERISDQAQRLLNLSQRLNQELVKILDQETFTQTTAA